MRTSSNGEDSPCLSSACFFRRIRHLQQQQVDLYDAHLQWLTNRPDPHCFTLKGAGNDAEVVGKPCYPMPNVTNGIVVSDQEFTRPIAVKVPLQRSDEAVHLPKDFELHDARSSRTTNNVGSLESESVPPKRRSDLSILFEDNVWGMGRDSGIPETQGRTDLPTDSKLVYAILIVQGGLPTSFLRGSCRQYAYKIYKCFVVFSFVFIGMINFGYAIMAINANLFPVEFCFFALFAIAGPVCTLLGWKLLHEKGTYMEFMHQAARRGFDWSSWRSFTYMWSVVTLGFLVIGPAFFSSILLSPGLGNYREQRMNATDFVLTVQFAASLLSLPSVFVTLSVGMCNIWLVKMFTELHRHDLLMYGAAVSRAFQMGDRSLEPVTVLKKLEKTIAARLRHANRTWVFASILILCLFFFMALVCASFLLAAEADWTSRVLPALYIVYTCFSISIVLSCMARVAETFEYDVLRTLNNPLDLYRAQAYFGQVMLSHLSSLEWGFRFGGTVISSKFVGRIIAGMVVSAVTTISTSMMRNL